MRTPSTEPLLTRFRSALDQLYGDRLERVLLFGSRARGDEFPDSDNDVAIFLKEMPDRWTELDRLLPLQIYFLETHGTFFTVLPFKNSDYSNQTGLMYAIRMKEFPSEPNSIIPLAKV